MFQPGEISKALGHLLAPLPEPVRLLSLTALPSRLVLQVQNVTNHSEVLQYSYHQGAVEGPEKVKLLGTGSLRDNLFRLHAADPRVAEEVLGKVRTQYSHAPRKLIMTRNLPDSMDIQFRVHLDTPDGELVLAADKTGRILGTIEPPPNVPKEQTP